MFRGIFKRLFGGGGDGVLGDWRTQYEAIFASMPVGISFLTRDMRFIRINPYLEKKIGMRSSEVEGRFCYDVVGMYSDDPDRKGTERICELCGVKNAIENGKPYKFTRKVRDGLVMENMGVPLRSEDGEVIGAAEILLDVTGRAALEQRLQEHAHDLEKAVEEKTRDLRKSRSFLDSIIQSTGDAIFTIDSSARIRFLNSAAERMLGRPAAMLLDTLLPELTDGPGGRLVESALAEAAGKGRTVSDVKVSVEGFGTGGRKVLQMSFAPLNNHDNAGTFVCICRDVTREDKLENDRREFIAMLSHDLKTPITSILAYSTLAMGRELAGTDVDLPKSLEAIRKNADRMLNLVNSFLSAGSMEADMESADRAPLMPEQVVRDCVLGLKPMFDDKGIKLNMELEGGVPEIMADEEHMERALLNLLSNAAKFTPEGGEVSVRLYRSGDGHAAIEVSDSGPGISGEDAPRIFDKYYRGSGGNCSSGVGLGLYITKSLVEANGGTVELKAAQDRGSNFLVRLPLSG